MNKLLMSSMAVGALLIGALPASAGPYIGADYNYVFTDYKTFDAQPQHFGGWNARIGWRFNHIALEGGYEWNSGHGASLNGATINALVFLKPAKADGVQPFIIGGISRMTSKSTAFGVTVKDSAYNWSAGTGLQWRNLRTSVKYKQLGTVGMDYAIVFSVGVQLGH